MGAGDSIIGTGLARGFRDRGKLAAFGDGSRILWDQHSPEIFANNPNVARPGQESHKDVEWVAHYKGNRKYNKHVNGRWHWNYDFKVKPGEFWFTEAERNAAARLQELGDFAVIEPNVEWHKQVAPNKDWGAANYDELAARMAADGRRVAQFIHRSTRHRLREVTLLKFARFRDAIAVLRLAKLYVGPEGGMHHAAAAVGIPAVVIFGGFIPPSVVGYDGHTNLTGGAEACGTIGTCEHCRQAMARISVDEVWDTATRSWPPR